MSEVPTWPKISGALGSTTTEFGASDWANLISDYFNGTNLALVDASKLPVIGSLTKFKFEKLGLYDVDGSHYLSFSVDDIDTGANRKVKFRRMNTPFEEDYAVLEGLSQAIINKTIDSDLNTITNIVNADIKAAAGIITTKLADSTNFVLTTRTNTFGDFDNIFKYNRLRINNPADTFAYTIIGAAIGANRNLTLPLLTANDTVVTEAFLQTLTNKEIDIKKNNFTRFSRVGWYNCAGKEIDGGGTLKDINGVGTLNLTLGTPGKYHRWTTATGTAGEMAGVYYLEHYVTVRQQDPLLRIMFLAKPNSSNNRRHFMGWTAQRIVTNSNTLPLQNSESGFLFGHGATDTNYKIFNNDGTGAPPTATDTGIAIPASDTYYILEIAADNGAASFSWTLWSVVTSGSGNLGSKNAQLGTGTLSSRIPGGTTLLYLQDILYNTLTTAIDNPILRMEVFSL